MGEPGREPVIFIVDDDRSVAEALARVLQSAGFSARTFSSASEFLSQHDVDTPGCLVTDLIMPDMDGLELQRALMSQGSARSIVFVTARGDVTTTVQGMRAGAISFLPKPVRKVELLAAVREALERDANHRAQLARRVQVQERLATLTPRERQVMELLVTGMLNKQIGAQLGAAEKTIKVHRARLMDKMQVRSAAALVQLLATSGVDVSQPAQPPRTRAQPEVRI